MLKATKFRYAYTGKQWSVATRNLETIEYVALSNPESRVFYNGHPGSEQRPTASVSDSRSKSDEAVISLIPLMLTVRAGAPHVRHLSDYTLTGRAVLIEGRECAEFSRGSRTEGEVEYLYLDPGRDWVARQLDVYTQEKLIMRVSAEYAPDPVAGWLPSTWSYVTRLPDGTALNSGRVTADRYEVNANMSDDEFRPKYPPGTFVVSDIKGKDTVSVVKDDGSPGVEVPLDQRPSYDQLVEANRSARRQWFWLVVLGGGVLIFAIVLIRRRQRGIRSTEAGPTTNGPTPPQ